MEIAYVSILVVLGAALLMIPARRGTAARPHWARLVLASAACVAGGVASGVAFGGAVAPTAAAAYVAAALFVAFLAFATR